MQKIFFFIFVFSCTVLLGSTKAINNKISLNNKILNSKKTQQKKTATKMKTLAKHIEAQEIEYEKIEKKLSNLNTTIFLNKVKLNKVKSQVIQLESQTKVIKQQSNKAQNDMIMEITNRYSASIGISLVKKQTTKAIIDKEIYTLLLEESTNNILKLNLQHLKSTLDAQKNKDKIIELVRYIKNHEEKKIKYKKLKDKKKDILNNLSKQHKNYQKKLKNIICKQKKLQDLLGKLNILKTKEIKKERLKQKRLKEARLKKQRLKKEKLKKAKQLVRKKPTKYKEIKISRKKKFQKEIDLNVRNIGSSTKGIKISKYKGRKTIPPLKSYKIVKKFGKYYDPVYKIELFNEALSMRPKKKNSKVYNVLPGKIVYAKKNSGTLENVVIVKHKNGLHTIYSHLDKIAPTLKTGKWIKKGFVVGRVSDTLMFQATRNSKYIDPRDLFK